MKLPLLLVLALSVPAFVSAQESGQPLAATMEVFVFSTEGELLSIDDSGRAA